MLEKAEFGDRFITDGGVRAVYIRRYNTGGSDKHFLFLEDAIIAYVYNTDGTIDSQYDLDGYNLKRRI